MEVTFVVDDKPNSMYDFDIDYIPIPGDIINLSECEKDDDLITEYNTRLFKVLYRELFAYYDKDRTGNSSTLIHIQPIMI